MSNGARKSGSKGGEGWTTPEQSSRVLVVDDEPTIRRAIRRCLPQYDMEFAETGEQALTLIQSGNFDVVLCDLRLPDMSGAEVFEAVFRDRPAMAKRIVMITGGACTSSAQHFLDSGRVAVLQKPFSPNQLRTLLTEQLKEAGPGKGDSHTATTALSA